MAVPPDFVSGQVLTAAQMNLIGLWEIKTQTIGTAVSSVTVTGAFSSDYDNYRIIVSGGVGSASSGLKLTLGSASANYYSGGSRFYYNGTTAANNVNNGSWWAAGTMSTNSIDLSVDLYSPNLAKRTTFTANCALSLADPTGFVEYDGGFLNDATQYTAFTLTPSTGTFTGGTIRVYGYRN